MEKLKSSPFKCEILSFFVSDLEDDEALPEDVPLAAVDGELHLREPPLQERQEQLEEGRPRRVVRLGPQSAPCWGQNHPKEY